MHPDLDESGGGLTYRHLLLAPLAACVTFALGLLVAFGMYMGGGAIPGKLASPYAEMFGAWWGLFGPLVLAPLLETLVLLLLYRGASSLKIRPVSALFLSAAIFSLLHARLWWGWGVIAFLPSVVLLLPFHFSRGNLRAYLFSALTHFFHNSYVLLFSAVVS
jgi:hypothetical protein